MIFCKSLIWSGINSLFIVTTPKPQKRKRFAGIVTKTKDGKHAFDVVRLEPKTFRPQRPDGKWSLKGVERVPYRLPELLQGVKDFKTCIILLEGEKDVDSAMVYGSYSNHICWRGRQVER